LPSDKDQRQPARLTDGELIALCRAAIDDLAALKGRSADVLQDSYFLLELAEKMTRPLIK
jgi:hypothetical protein